MSRHTPQSTEATRSLSLIPDVIYDGHPAVGIHALRAVHAEQLVEYPDGFGYGQARAVVYLVVGRLAGEDRAGLLQHFEKGSRGILYLPHDVLGGLVAYLLDSLGDLGVCLEQRGLAGDRVVARLGAYIGSPVRRLLRYPVGSAAAVPLHVGR